MPVASTPRILVGLATYNERENLAGLLDAILAELPAAHVLVVDDHSPDGTGQLADEYACRDSRVRVLHRPGKLGLGSALLAQVHHAIEQSFDYLISMDADFSHPPRYLKDLIAGMADHDVMIGSRYVAGGGIVGWNWKRRIMSWGVNTYSRLLLGVTARDCSGAYRGYRVAMLQGIVGDAIISRGYSFLEEFLFHCMRQGARVGETPIVFENRRHGRSKIDLREIISALWCLWLARWRFGRLR